MKSTTQEYHLNVRAGGKSYHFDFQQAFRYGYSLLRTRRYQEAAKVFEAMTRTGAACPLVLMMLAYCRAGLKDFEGCNSLLCAAMRGKMTGIDQVQAAFVYLSLGMWKDAIQELSEIVRAGRGTPVICLMLGDLLAFQGRRTDAVRCWRLAVARDNKNGAVAAIARRLISAHMNPRPKS